jgi:hypothetical protein
LTLSSLSVIWLYGVMSCRWLDCFYNGVVMKKIETWAISNVEHPLHAAAMEWAGGSVAQVGELEEMYRKWEDEGGYILGNSRSEWWIANHHDHNDLRFQKPLAMPRWLLGDEHE